MRAIRLAVSTVLLVAASAAAIACGDPQTRTGHPWYPGELSCSTFERLFETQSKLYERITGRRTGTDEDKALAAWYWRNINYHHADDARADTWGTGYAKGDYNREYWTGLFAYGFGLCYTTHAQWCGEMEYLLGHGRARAAGVPGHTSFEVYLKGGAYGSGRWALLDHDISTVIFHENGSRLLSIAEIAAELGKYSNPRFKRQRQRGWLVGGLHPTDPKCYKRHKTALYYYGYAGVPPMIHLRPGETLRRYTRPGLEDGKRFVFWGQNYMTITKITGPERTRTWVNQPERMYRAKRDCGHKPGQGRYGNAVFTYTPDFGGSYERGVIDESPTHVTFEFTSPYVIAATPPDLGAAKPDRWGVYKNGCTGGLVLGGSARAPVAVSVDGGATWHEAGAARDGLDLTDVVKGCRQYRIRFGAGARQLAGSGLTMTTVCQLNPCLVPHLAPGRNKITFESSGRAVVSTGRTVAQAKRHVVDGGLKTPRVTLELSTLRGERAVHVYANAHVASGSPPRNCVYQIEYSTDGGSRWKSVVRDWRVERHKPEPNDFWSQSMCFGDTELPGVTGPVRVRFRNDGGRKYLRVEAHLVYEARQSAPVEVTYAWRAGAGGVKTESHTYAARPGAHDTSWSISAPAGAKTEWVEYRVAGGR